MRPAIIVAVLLLAGCLEGGDDPAPPAGSPTLTPRATPTATPPATPIPSPTATPTTPASPTPNATGEIEIRSLASGQQGGIQTRERTVFHDETAYAAWWGRMSESNDPPPAVDFARETVVAATSGPRSNTCWALRVTNATASGNGGTLVEVTTFEPPPDLICGQAITYPWHLAALSGPDRGVTFRESTAAGPPPE